MRCKNWRTKVTWPVTSALLLRREMGSRSPDESLAQEVRAFGIQVTSIEPGDPQAAPDAILKIVYVENPPLRFAVGSTILRGLGSGSP